MLLKQSGQYPEKGNRQFLEVILGHEKYFPQNISFYLLNILALQMLST